MAHTHGAGASRTSGVEQAATPAACGPARTLRARTSTDFGKVAENMTVWRSGRMLDRMRMI